MQRTGELRLRVLVIGPNADVHVALRRIFDESPWNLQSSFTCQDGIDLLHRNHPTIEVVICEECLPDGDWKNVLTELDKAPVRMKLIVSSRLADEQLWAEVLNLGAFDLLRGGPFEPEEVLRVTESAWLAGTGDHFRDERRCTRISRAPKAARDTGLVSRPPGMEPLAGCQTSSSTKEKGSRIASASGKTE
jgi:DNA-binding NtrC family response regulator